MIRYISVYGTVLCLWLLTLSQVAFGQDMVTDDFLDNIEFEIVSNVTENQNSKENIPYLVFEVFATNHNKKSITLLVGQWCNSFEIYAYTTPDRSGEAVWNGFPSDFDSPLIRECLDLARERKFEPKQRVSMLTQEFGLDEIPLSNGHYYFSWDLRVHLDEIPKKLQINGLDAGDAYIETSNYVPPVPTYKEQFGIGYTGRVKEHDNEIQLDLEVTSTEPYTVIDSHPSNRHFPQCSISLVIYRSEAELDRWLWNWPYIEDTWPYYCLVKEFEAITLSKQGKFVFTNFIDEPDWNQLGISEAYFLVVSNLRIEGAMSNPVAVLIGKLEF